MRGPATLLGVSVEAVPRYGWITAGAPAGRMLPFMPGQ